MAPRSLKSDKCIERSPKGANGHGMYSTKKKNHREKIGNGGKVERRSMCDPPFQLQHKSKTSLKVAHIGETPNTPKRAEVTLTTAATQSRKQYTCFNILFFQRFSRFCTTHTKWLLSKTSSAGTQHVVTQAYDYSLLNY